MEHGGYEKLKGRNCYFKNKIFKLTNYSKKNKNNPLVIYLLLADIEKKQVIVFV